MDTGNPPCNPGLPSRNESDVVKSRSLADNEQLTNETTRSREAEPIAKMTKRKRNEEDTNELKTRKLRSDTELDNAKKTSTVVSAKEINLMFTKTFEPKEMLPFGQLRTLNQKDLLRTLDENAKLGIVIKDQLKVAMIDMDKYEKLVETVQEHARLLEWLEERELFERVHTRLNSDEWEELPEGTSLLEWAGIHTKG